MVAKIGDVIIVKGVKLLVVEDVNGDCADCAGNHSIDLCCDSPACSFIFREDENNVIYKKVDDNETS